MKVIWIVGKSLDIESSGWDFQGAYDKQELAEEYCIDETYFVGPCIVNDAKPSDQDEWQGAYYPTLEVKKIAIPTSSAEIIELPGRTRPNPRMTE